LVGVLRIAEHSIEINDSIEVAGGTYPFVYGLAVGFAERAGMVVGGAHVRRYGGAVHAEVVGVSTHDDLLVGGEDSLNEGGVI
jgi:hypothetical protein